MSYYIYGLHVGDDPECRYIGMTRRTADTRLSYLTYIAKRSRRLLARRNRIPDPEGFSSWLIDHDGDVTAFNIGKVDTEAEARVMERAIIALVLRLGHRLFNRQHVPSYMRLPDESVEAA